MNNSQIVAKNVKRQKPAVNYVGFFYGLKQDKQILLSIYF